MIKSLVRNSLIRPSDVKSLIDETFGGFPLINLLKYYPNFFLSTKEEDVQPPPGLNNLELWKSQNDPTSGMDPNLDSTWTPSRKCELNSPTPMVSSNTEQPSQPNLTIGHANKLSLESPPEAAIEATPETTPFVTPVKVGFFFHRSEFPL